MNWAAFLVAITGPVVIRVLSTLGFGFVTYTGVSSVLSIGANFIQSNLSAAAADIASIVFMSGIPQGMAIVLSAMAARVAMMTLTKLQKI